MSNKKQDSDRWNRPEIFLAELINKSVRGEFVEESQQPVIWHRAVVYAIDIMGGLLENPSGEGILTHVIDGKSVNINANIGPLNPRNSIKARIITNERDQFVSDDDLLVFWPMMSEHDQIPIKPGEHVYVTFEDSERRHGLWFGKVPGHNGINFARGESFYNNEANAPLTDMFDDSKSVEEKSTDNKASGRLIGRNKVKLFEDS